MSHVRKVLANQSSDKKQYRLRRYDKPDESVAKVIHKPILSKEEIQKIQKTPLHRRIGLTLKESKDTNILKPHEAVFAERFTDLGYRIHWINRIQPAKNNKGYAPTNDFEWDGIEWELKRPEKARYGSVKPMLKRGATSGKKNFVIDLKRATLRKKLAEQLSLYNQNNPEHKISKLLLFDRDGIKEIVLKK